MGLDPLTRHGRTHEAEAHQPLQLEAPLATFQARDLSLRMKLSLEEQCF
jgi:hypothetical protein